MAEKKMGFTGAGLKLTPKISEVTYIPTYNLVFGPL